MNSTYCQSQAYNWTVANSLKNYADAQRFLNNLCQNNCQLPAGAVCAGQPSTPPINHHPAVTPPPVTPPPLDPCTNYRQQYDTALTNNDKMGQLNAANALCANQCPMPVRWHCADDGTAFWHDDPNNNTPVVTPVVTPSSTPPPSQCDTLLLAYNMAKNQNSAAGMANFVQQMCAAGCQMPAGVICPPPPQPSCNDYMNDFNTAVANSDTDGVKAAVRNMCLRGCKLPAGWTCDNEGPGPVNPGGNSGNTPSGGGVQPVGPAVNPCTGEQSLTLVDYLISLPLAGVKDDPLLATGLAAAGGVASAITVTLFVPEAGKYVRIPAAVAGAYGGLIVNGILDNYGFIQNAEKDGIVFGTLVTGLGAVHGLYQSIHQTTEKFLKTELGGVFGEITYKAAEFVFQGGPIGWVSDIVWGDRTWTTAGYDKAKCDANCGNPKLSSTERKLCKIGARLDLKF